MNRQGYAFVAGVVWVGLGIAHGVTLLVVAGIGWFALCIVEAGRSR